METIRVRQQAADLARRHYQYLEDLATGYWQSEVLFAALELRLFDCIEAGPADSHHLAAGTRCHAAPLERLLGGLEALGLVRSHDGTWFNTQVSRLYLLPGEPGYLGDFLLYRRYLQDPWRGLARRVAKDPDVLAATVSPGDGYAVRNLHYVRSMDALARRKGEEIFQVLARERWTGPILDVGGGAGALCRQALCEHTGQYAVLLELPEILAAARALYLRPEDWRDLHGVAADVRTEWPIPAQGGFGLVILSNILHAYDAPEALTLLDRAAARLRPGGLLLIHDYFPDHPSGSAKGALYDLNMLLNTYDGRCHSISSLTTWLSRLGLEAVRLKSLPSDSALILAGGTAAQTTPDNGFDDLALTARRLGFVRAVPLDADQIVTAPWVRVKCRFGCDRYGKGLTCPPHGREHAETAALIRSYSKAVLLEGEPPAREFHRRLLKMENSAFMAGYHKVLGFGAGPCPVCESCPDDAACRFPEKARPSMEASGIDVYATARAAGLDLMPAPAPGEYVKYIGLLLLE